MKAAVVNEFGQIPYYGDIEAPKVGTGEVLVHTRAAALSQLVRAQAAGKHYSCGKILPVVPGADGVGVLENGQRVFFAFPKPPIGSMAEAVAVRSELCVPIPEFVDDITAAAIGNPGMSSIAALEFRAGFQPGESVLVNGAAGVSGRLAIQIAKELGASRVVATARKPEVEAELRALGADHFVLLHADTEILTAEFQLEMQSYGIDVVLDYLWGQPASCLLQAAANVVAEPQRPRIRFVNIGGLAGMSLSLSAGLLRSTGVELKGSGLGSVSNENLVNCIGKLLKMVEPAKLAVDAMPMPLKDVQSAWQTTTSRRIVLTV
ncbi:zinc-binding alcohol dehydrogenase family protein [Aestuariicella hydrocarbonica]|uniref:Zinc-binding alcohol dehydrogenase family protein n=1 Tax=Pseudomaricurvus hydrocarbonicus TaxID=1470433 RepID=A0A9E5JWF1_9GAMM|nr:zinc-binding alcohol dehydrogenase family protein [Aestuariicella hydrocarbonica]NHO65816.1 zinc-binding alcohol dehydrogenase family protein [Aestuariicella hydrocarbonica]